MKTKFKIISAIALFGFVLLLVAGKVSDTPRVVGIASTNILYVITNSGPSTYHSANITASNLLESFKGFDNWVAAGGGGAGSMPFNTAQFTTNTTVVIRSGALLTNTSLRFPALANATAVDSVVVLDGENQLTNSAVVSVTELNYLDGVTSAIQSQINGKASFSENTLKIYLETNGVDSTAVLGDPSKPFGTLAAAATNIVNNSALIIGPGSFNYVPTINTNGNTGATLTTPIVIERKTNVTILGHGFATLFESGTNWGEFISMREVDRVTVKDIFIKNRRLTGPEHGTFALTNKNWSMINFYGTNANIVIDGVNGMDITRQFISHLFGPRRTTNVVIQNCWIWNLGVTNVPGAVIHDGAFVAGVGDYWTIQNNRGFNMFRGVELESSSTPSDTVTHIGIKVLNNEFRGMEESGFDAISPYKEVIIEGNTFEMITNFVYAGAQAAIKLSGYGEYQIVNNTVKGGDYGLYSEVRNTNWLIQGNIFMDVDDGVALLDVTGTGAGSHSHMIKDNYFIRVLNRAVHVGGRDMFITGNHFIDCQHGATANQGIIRIIGGGYSTNITVRNNFSRNVEKTTTNLYVVELGGGNHVIEDNDFRDYVTGVYFGTAPGSTFGFNGIAVNSATAPTDGDVLTYDSATGVYTNKVSTGGSGTPEGANTQVQFNDGGAFGGLSNLMYFKASGTIQFSNNIGNGFVDFAAPVTFKTVITNEGPLYQLFPAIGESHLIYRQPDGLLTTYSTIYDMVHTNSNSTNFVTDVVDVGTPASGDLIPIVDVSTATRKYVSIANLPAGSGDTNWVATTTEHAYIDNLYMTGPGPGILTLFNSTETAALSMQMSEVPIGTNRIHFSLNTNTIAVDQVLKVHSVAHTSSGTDVTLTNAVGGGSSGPTTNAPPYTVPITGTNFVIDWLALGPTNDIVLTNYAAAGILNTNIIPGKVIRARIDQGSQGFQTIVPNTNYFGPNWRYTSVQTGITQSTNGGYEDFIVLYGSRTNAVLSGQNWGAAP